MGYEYKSLEDLKRKLPSFRSFSNPAEIKLIIICEEEKERVVACGAAKEVLESMLKNEIPASIKGYEVKIIDVSREKGHLSFTTDWQRAGNKDGFIFVSIYNNADEHRNLAQEAFDERLPVVLSVSSKGYNAIHNSSKRDCYDLIRV